MYSYFLNLKLINQNNWQEQKYLSEGLNARGGTCSRVSQWARLSHHTAIWLVLTSNSDLIGSWWILLSLLFSFYRFYPPEFNWKKNKIYWMAKSHKLSCRKIDMCFHYFWIVCCSFLWLFCLFVCFVIRCYWVCLGDNTLQRLTESSLHVWPRTQTNDLLEFHCIPVSNEMWN